MKRKKKAKVEQVKKNNTSLPDELFYSKQSKEGKKVRAKKEFFKNLKDEDYNPNAKEDFDKLLGEMLKLKEGDLE